MARKLKDALIGLLLTLMPCAVTAGVSAAQITDSTPQRHGLFEEPLVPFHVPTTADRQALDMALAEYASEGDAARIEPLTHYLEQSADSPWRASLLLNLALVRERTGYFSEALTLLEQARRAAAAADAPAEEDVAARALGELLGLHTRFGHRERVEELLAGVASSPASASISEQVTAARSGLWQMQNEPEEALRCGIIALQALLGEGRLDEVKAGRAGTSLADLLALAERRGIPAEAVLRTADQPIPAPSVVHWRLGHFAAILDEAQGRYRVRDPAYGQELWMTREALESEASGYFLVPRADNSPLPWQPLAAAEAAGIVGSGYPPSSDPSQTSEDDLTECGKQCPALVGKGMPHYRVHSMLVSLNIRDTPVGYTPPVGPPVPLTLTYSQREAYQPATFTYFNFGPKWTFNWLSYVQDDPLAPGSRVLVYLPGGGSRGYGGYNAGNGTFTPEQRTGAQLVRVAASPIRYERRMPNGSRYVYEQSDGSGYYPRRIFLTQVVDEAGNPVRLQYDAALRLTEISDALGQTTALAYEDAGRPLQVTGLTDPFGRSAHIGYDASGRLEAITDALGVTSTFKYNSGTFINAMTTPYGTTGFAYGESGTTRWVEITDPQGERERVEYRHGAPGIPFSDSPLPTGMNLFNNYINGRNTFYWDTEAMRRAAGDYTQARIRHWYHLRTNTSVTTGVLESDKNPLERRIWYNYPGQSWAGAEGTLDKPSIIGRVLPDSTTQLTHRSYNAIGKLTREIDPEGREHRYEYAANGIDLLRIFRKSASGYQVLAEYTYNDQHRPLTYTGPAGELTTYVYNPTGQLTAVTNPLGHTTRYEHDAQGDLLAVIDPNGQPQVRYSYDALGRIASRTDAAGYTLTYAYDTLDRLIRTTYPDGTHEEVSYDKLQVGSRSDRYGNLTHFSYDALGNRLSETDPSGHLTQYGYFANGELASRTDGRGNLIRWERDIQRRITAEIRPNGFFSTTYSFDSVGRRTRITDPLRGNTDYGYAHDDRVAAVTDPNGHTTRYGYDPFSGERIVQDSPDSGRTTYRFDSAGNLIEQTDANGQSTTYRYDALNRPARIDYADGQVFEYRYDSAPNGIGRLAEIHDPSGITAYEYDAGGRITTRTQSAPEGGTLLTRTRYSPAGLPEQITYPSGAVVSYGYQGERPVSLQLDGAPVLSDLSYAPFGPLAGWSRANGLTDSRSYDAAGALEVFSVGPHTRALTHDAVGNIIEILGESGLTQSYRYDPLDRLTTAVSADFDLSYGYDPNGNRTAETDAGVPHSYAIAPGSNRLAARDGQPYTYDANGNTLDEVTHRYRYDARNRLVAVDEGTTIQVMRGPATKSPSGYSSVSGSGHLFFALARGQGSIPALGNGKSGARGLKTVGKREEGHFVGGIQRYLQVVAARWVARKQVLTIRQHHGTQRLTRRGGDRPHQIHPVWDGGATNAVGFFD